MSRVAKKPVELPQGVTATVAAGRSVHGSGRLARPAQGCTAATTEPAISTAAANPATIAMAAWRGRARAG